MNSRRNRSGSNATQCSNNNEQRSTATATGTLTGNARTSPEGSSNLMDKSSGAPQPEAGVCVNFMSKFRDKDTRVLKNLNSTQFIEVWNNYDKDGK